MSSASRGAALVAIAALLCFLVLRGAADSTQVPVASEPALPPTPTALPDLEVDSQDTVDVGAPTIEVDVSTARPNNQVSVLVANGTEVSGQASRLTSALRNQGFLTREPRNSEGQAASTIFYRPTFAAEATVVRSVLGGATPIAPMPEPEPDVGDNIDLAEVDVFVLVGDDDLANS